MDERRNINDRLYRLVEIHHLLLRETPGLTANMLAERFRVNNRTIRRDLSYLREHLGAPIEFDRHQYRYRYVGPFQLLPELFLTDEEVSILAALRELHQGQPLVRKLMERLAVGAAEPSRERVETWKRRLEKR